MEGRSRAEPLEEWQEARQLWGDKLVPISPGLVGRNISDFTRTFLMNAGLPGKGPLGVTFYHDERLLDLHSVGATGYLAIGEDYGTILGMKIETGEMWSLDPREECPSRFVNSRLSDFVLFLGVYGSRAKDRQHASDEQHEVIVQEMRRQFISRDPRALDHVEHWWSLIFEQMSHGLL